MEIKNNFSRTRGLTVGIIVFLLILLLALAGYFYRRNANTGVERLFGEEISLADFRVKTTELPVGANPVGIPVDLPMQEGNQILANTESRATDGRIQSVKKFSTSLTVAKALQTYVSFFESKGWVRNSSGALQSPVLLRNKQNALSISAVRGLGESYTVVEISLIQVNQ